ncbi:MAG: hypothetical protein PVI33_06025 [Candidatus Omnitrophota bacterium]|jgi:hypothetical protein
MKKQILLSAIILTVMLLLPKPSLAKQTFHWVNPQEINITATGWQTYDLDDYIFGLGSDVTGVMLHIFTDPSTTRTFNLRKYGSSDNRPREQYFDAHLWGITGVDSEHRFQIYTNDTDFRPYVIGYTTTGVTFFTNATEFGGSMTAGSWQDIDTSSIVPSNAIGLIWEYSYSGSASDPYGFRNNGSNDTVSARGTYQSWAIIGCDSSQICEGYKDSTSMDFWLIGYITDGAVFHVNDIDRSINSNEGTWQDITCSTGAAGVFICIHTSDNYDHGLRRKTDSAFDTEVSRPVYTDWAFIGGDANYQIQGRTDDPSFRTDYYEVGYATSPFSVKAEGIEAEAIEID